MKPIFIAEIKQQSPNGWKNHLTFYQIMSIAVEHGDWISVHVDGLWGGDHSQLALVRRATTKPILAKGLHATDESIQRSFDFGADFVLVADRLPDHRFCVQRLLIEHQNPFAVRRWAEQPDAKLVYNSRNIYTGGPRDDEFTINDYPATCPWICQASNIMGPDDVSKSASAFIVGTNLELFIRLKKRQLSRPS